MTNENGSISCTLGCWLVALLGGVLAVILLLLLGAWTFVPAVFAGLVIAGIAGALLSRIMCKPLPAVNAASEAAPSDAEAKAAAAEAEAKAKSEAVTTPPPVAAQTEAAVKSRAKTAPAAKPAVKPAAKPAAKPKAAKAAKAVTNPKPSSGGSKPETLSAARDGVPDDLKQIKGVGPKLEGVLHSMGFYHFDQIAAWGADEIAWADQNLVGFKGRVSRDDWVSQAKTLAEGGTTEFSKKVKKGGVY
ncbi:endonuclease [Tateyamaria sp.]|uniref:endonuclease n=1 Tax=Tateyamaria sp. TaxID=1929288 RepID=UPI00329D3467